MATLSENYLGNIENFGQTEAALSFDETNAPCNDYTQPVLNQHGYPQWGI